MATTNLDNRELHQTRSNIAPKHNTVRRRTMRAMLGTLAVGVAIGHYTNGTINSVVDRFIPADTTAAMLAHPFDKVKQEIKNGEFPNGAVSRVETPESPDMRVDADELAKPSSYDQTAETDIQNDLQAQQQGTEQALGTAYVETSELRPGVPHTVINDRPSNQ
jgi:hypothetical protein